MVFKLGAISLSGRVFMRRSFNYLFTLAVPVAAAGLALAWMLDFGGAGKSSVVYDTTAVSKGSIRKIVSTSGPVRALVTVSVGSQLSGQVETVKVDFNTEVSPGEVLAVLDDKTFAAKVAQAKADLAAAEAGLENQQAALIKAESVERLSILNKDRQGSLAAKGFSAQSALDSAIRDSEVAKADIAVSKAQIASAKATIQQRKAALDQALIDLERTTIRSPIEGTVISRTVDPGQTVAASLQAPELFKIAQDLSRIRIEAQVNEADVGAVSEGNSATFTVDAHPDQQFEGRVTQVRLSATELNSVVTYTVIIEAANEGRKLFPGMTANVAIVSDTREGALRVSNDAFRFKPKGAAAADNAGTGNSQQAGRGDGSGRMLERLKSELDLTAEQEKIVKETLDKLGQEMRDNAQGGFTQAPQDRSAVRQRMAARIDQALAPLLNEKQRAAYDMWKKGREQVKPAALWVVGANGYPERRMIRTGLSDDQVTEIVGGNLKEGDAVIIRAREARP